MTGASDVVGAVIVGFRRLRQWRVRPEKALRLKRIDLQRGQIPRCGQARQWVGAQRPSGEGEGGIHVALQRACRCWITLAARFLQPQHDPPPESVILWGGYAGGKGAYGGGSARAG